MFHYALSTFLILWFIIRNWLAGFGGWEVPQCTICKLETQESLCYSLKARNPENQWYRFQFEFEVSRTRSTKGRRRWMSSSNSQAEREFNLFPPFYSVQALNGLDNVHLHWGGPSTLLSPLIQIQISSGNILPGIPRNNV